MKSKFILLYFCLLSIFQPIYAQEDIMHYSKDVDVEVREPKQASIDKFHRDDLFQYDDEQHFSPGLLDRFIWWLLEKVYGKLEYSEVKSFTSNIWDYFVIPSAILIILIVILKFLGVNFSGIFGRKTKELDLKYQTDNENVKSSDFDTLLEKALEDKNYRLGVRYLYLKSLQQLNDHQLIKWHPNKTNHSYINELIPAGRPLQKSFREILYLFELIWYGEYQIQEKEFEQVHRNFSLFNQSIHQTTEV